MKRFSLIFIAILISMELAFGSIEESMFSENAYAQPGPDYYQGEPPLGEFYGGNSFGPDFQPSFLQNGLTGSGYAAIVPQIGGNYLPPGAPKPPDLNAENLMLPDYNLLRPGSAQVGYPPQTFSSNYQAMYPQQSIAVPPAYGCQTVYPQPCIRKHNGYYVQIQPGRVCTQAGVRCGECLPLWSKIGRDGTYWSYEWTQCGYSYCYPEVRNFGYKRMGWYQTLFTSNKPGWHILSYWCNDWSNYIYIYVWPIR